MSFWLELFPMYSVVLYNPSRVSINCIKILRISPQYLKYSIFFEEIMLRQINHIFWFTFYNKPILLISIRDFQKFCIFIKN